MSMAFSTTTVARLTGSTIRMIDYWVRTGILKPSEHDAKGRGSRRRFTFKDVVILQTIRELRQGECPLQKIRTAIKYLKTHYPDASEADALARLTLLTDGKRVYLLTDGNQVMDVISRQMVWAVPIGKLIRETTERLESLPQSWREKVLIHRHFFNFVLSRTRRGENYVAECPEFPGSRRDAPTAQAAIRDLKQSLELLLAPGTKAMNEKRRAVSAQIAAG